jgi:type IV secretory pathway VirB10-like protein
VNRVQACTALILAAACLAPLAGQAREFNKCVIDGKVAYQDTPCPAALETVGQEIRRKQRVKEMERKLDLLQAQGKGMIQRPAPKPPEPPPPSEPEPFVARSRASREAQQAQISARHQARSERTNAESAARMTRDFDEMKAACGGQLPQFPTVGMSDETFRNCTIHARMGGVTQIVVSEDGNIPLRLYIFPSEKASRVYAVGGVITTIKP